MVEPIDDDELADLRVAIAEHEAGVGFGFYEFEISTVAGLVARLDAANDDVRRLLNLLDAYAEGYGSLYVKTVAGVRARLAGAAPGAGGAGE